MRPSFFFWLAFSVAATATAAAFVEAVGCCSTPRASSWFSPLTPIARCHASGILPPIGAEAGRIVLVDALSVGGNCWRRPPPGWFSSRARRFRRSRSMRLIKSTCPFLGRQTRCCFSINLIEVCDKYVGRNSWGQHHIYIYSGVRH